MSNKEKEKLENSTGDDAEKRQLAEEDGDLFKGDGLF